MITADTITPEQIRELRIAAARRADHFVAALCAVALDDQLAGTTMQHLSRVQTLAIYTMTTAEARERCADIINRRSKP